MRNSKISTARGALDLRGTVGFLVSAESVTGLDEENSELPYCSFPLTVVSTVKRLIRSSEFIRNENATNVVRQPGTTKDSLVVGSSD